MEKVLILGSGGREHAIGWAFLQAGFQVDFYPGNAGTARCGRNVKVESWDALGEYDLVIPGSEEYLAMGVADGRPNVFGPDSKGAFLEASKCFAKSFMMKYDIPTARYEIADDEESLLKALEKFTPPFVLKLDGLAQGKGVVIAQGKEQAYEVGVKMMKGDFVKGVSGKLVVEEFLRGKELSAIGIVHGRKFALLPFTRDYKRAFTGNVGPNTGGMGAYGPVHVDGKLKAKIEEIFSKTLFGLEKEGIFYKGFLYAGLMLVNDEPYVLEFNVRLGDPETEVIVYMDPEHFVENVLKAFAGEPFQEYYPNHYAVDVVIASEGYPEFPRKGQEIIVEPGGFYYFAGVSETDGRLYVSGGRVIHAMGRGSTLEKAREEAYQNVSKVHFEGMFYRTDIAAL
ncbi:phosphoribosylamine--glycine ligase [Fervidobacterium thailandense]|uniref:phosphoribosylamine--glycine ligase n=1 Tax=Fervidobacterium thailandense TaxID=1008305 RepID=A0A1E3G366_9BACT|nr:phosphoribosylamine--glycine ligase [Fervidobacterium thailandense]ODN30273.1 phosphoribosylamine--glycine ligase [Fervidobacterium thailandense]